MNVFDAYDLEGRGGKIVFANYSALRKDLLVKVLDYSKLGIHIVDDKGVTIYYNEAAEIIDGMKCEDMLGKSMQQMVESGVFSSSVALEVLGTKKEKEITQRVNNRSIQAIGVPIFIKEKLNVVVVYIMNVETIERLSLKLEEMKKENQQMAKDLSQYQVKYLSEDRLLYKSKKMQRVVNLGEKVAKVDSTILIEGESGVGKTMFAKYIHKKSHRSDMPFVKVDCSSIPESLFESELFGYKPGAFTGALKSGKDGLVQAADKGTLFLDEVAEVPLESQVKLLTLLQEKTIQPVGSTERIKVDIRVIAATNQDLQLMIEEGRFRKDLYYRLKVVPIVIPPLRERTPDIVPLIQIFVNKLNNYYGFNNEISPGGMRNLINYSWPGNVRELENIIERLLVTTEGNVVSAEEVAQDLEESYKQSNDKLDYRNKVINFEKQLIEEESKRTSSIRELSVNLNINESTLRKKIERYGIDLKY